MDSIKDFEDKIAIVTGGGTGIGKEVARKLLRWLREMLLSTTAEKKSSGMRRTNLISVASGSRGLPATPPRSLSQKDLPQLLSSASADSTS
jgi:hypothetical protein